MYLSNAARDLSPVYLQMSASFAVQITSQLDRRLYIHYTESLKNQCPKSYSMQVCYSDDVYTETAGMCDVGNVFAADILYHDNCHKGYFNKYQARIEEIMKNLKMEDSVTTADDSFQARFLGDELRRCLPAIHALTGCDATSKVSTKLPAQNALRKPGSSSLY